MIIPPHDLDRMISMGLPIPDQVDVRRLNALGQDLLIQAASSGITRVVAAALPRADLAFRDPHGMSALHAAARMGATHCVRLLLPFFSPTEPSSAGRCALIHAASSGSPDCVAALLAAGADPKRVSRGGWSALMRAADELDDECFLLLLPVSDASAKNDQGDTAFDIALKRAESRGASPGNSLWARWEAIRIQHALGSPRLPSAGPLSMSL